MEQNILKSNESVLLFSYGMGGRERTESAMGRKRIFLDFSDFSQRLLNKLVISVTYWYISL